MEGYRRIDNGNREIMKLTEFLKELDYTVTTSGVSFEDEHEGFYIDIYFDPRNSANNKVEVKTDMATIKLSLNAELNLYKFLEGLWIEEVEATESDRELNREQLDNILSYGV